MPGVLGLYKDFGFIASVLLALHQGRVIAPNYR